MNYQPKMQPYPHQLEALSRLNGRNAFALLMAMRTGKTKVLLDDFGQLELDGKVSDLLVIAPAGVYRTWETAVRDHVSSTLQHRLRIHTWNSSANGQKETLRRREFLASTHPRLLLMNVEALSAVQRAQDFCIQFLRNPAQAMIAVDESTIIKSPKALRTKFINRELARRAAYRRILSGLPTPRSPLDLFCQFQFLDERILGFSSFYGWSGFQNRYAIIERKHMGGRWVPIVVGYRHVDELHAKIDPHSFRVPFRPDIPSTYTIREVPWTEKQKKVYEDIKNFATSALENGAHVTATVVIAQILRLHQVLCGHVRDEAGNLHEIPEHRTGQLLELLEDYAGKAVIWCSYGHSIGKLTAALAKEYGENAVAAFWGGNVAIREDEEKRFLNDPQCRFMLATPHAGGKGRTWSVADLVVYYSSNNDLELRDQSEQRVQGLGKQRQVDYIDLIVPGTVEGKILTALRKKINMAATITGDDWREWIV